MSGFREIEKEDFELIANQMLINKKKQERLMLTMVPKKSPRAVIKSSNKGLLT
jgi:hypothetical protein